MGGLLSGTIAVWRLLLGLRLLVFASTVFWGNIQAQASVDRHTDKQERQAGVSVCGLCVDRN